MTAYHGTCTTGLHTLQPFANPDSNLQYPCVYLSTSKPLAAIYLWPFDFKWMTFHMLPDGRPQYNESFQNSLQYFYGGVSGCIYTCQGDFEADENTTIQTAVVSKEPVAIAAADAVEDALRRILDYESQGQLVIRRFEDMTEAQHRQNRSMVTAEIKRLALWSGRNPMATFVAEKFPDIYESCK